MPVPGTVYDTHACASCLCLMPMTHESCLVLVLSDTHMPACLQAKAMALMRTQQAAFMQKVEDEDEGGEAVRHLGSIQGGVAGGTQGGVAGGT